MALPDSLLATAKELVPDRRGSPDQARLRRAVSTAYYALFHKMLERSADEIVGVTAHSAMRNLVSRAFGHGAMKDLAVRLADNRPPQILQDVISMVPTDLATVARTLVVLQEERHRADYDLARPFKKAEVVQLVQWAEGAIHVLAGQPSAEMKHFLIVLPMWPQLKSR